MAGRAWRAWVVGGVGALLLMLCACSNDLNALYARAPKGSGGSDAGARAAVPILPALPDVGKRAECEACAKDNCAMARDKCLQDDDCIDQLRCKGKCSDPACLEACDVRSAFSIWYRDYQFCVFATADKGGRCSVECGVGENWGCLGQYAFRAASNAAYEVEMHFVGPEGPNEPNRNGDFPPLAGATVRACTSFSVDCGVTNLSSLLSEATIGGYGGATLELRGRYDAPLQITGGATSELAALYAQPYTGPQRRELVFVWRPGHDSFRPGGGLGVGFPIDGPDRTHVLVAQLDCLGAPAPGVIFWLAGDFDGAYVGALGRTSGTDRTGTSGVGVLGLGLGGASDRTLFLEGHRADGGEVLSRRTVVVALDWSTLVYLLPLEHGER